MEFSPWTEADHERLSAFADSWVHPLRGEVVWSSERTEAGCTWVWSDGGIWAVAVKAVPTPDRGPLIQEIRVLPSDLLSSSVDARAVADRNFWLDPEDEEYRAENANEWFWATDTGGITSSVLRGVPWGTLFDSLRADFGDVVEALGLEPAPELWLERASGARPGKRGSDLGDAHYAAVAARYVELVAGGEREPVEALTSEWNARHGKAEQRERDSISTWLKQARKRGLLVSAGRGKAGGTLSDRARRLLATEGDDHGERK